MAHQKVSKIEAVLSLRQLHSMNTSNGQLLHLQLRFQLPLAVGNLFHLRKFVVVVQALRIEQSSRRFDGLA